MKSKYSELFKNIVKAYNQGTYEDTIKELLSDSEVDKEQLCNIISALSGVQVYYSENFIEELKEAIIHYDSKHKIVFKAKKCSMSCRHDEHSETACQKSCPFNAIMIDDESKTTYINEEICVDCGMCVEACPSGGILDKVEFLPLLNMLKSKTPVIAAVAPAIAGQFGDDVSINMLRAAFKKMGFIDMVEVAFFADMLTLKEAVEFDHHVQKKEDLMITSCCCPMWVGMLKRVYNDMVKYVSPSVSPMIAAGRVLKKLNTNCKVVFIGPCIAKKAEAKEKDLVNDIDFVLTFTELKDIFESLNINLKEMPEDISSEYASMGGRLYARAGGVSIAVSDAMKTLFPKKYELLKPAHANGVKECKEILLKAHEGTIDANFIEGMGCIGGCVGGPKAIIPKEQGKIAVDTFAESSEIKIATESSCMLRILNEIGINSIEDFKDESKIQIFERQF